MRLPELRRRFVWMTAMMALLASVGNAWAAASNKVVDVADFDRVYLQGAAVLHVHQNGERSVEAVGTESILTDLVIESSDGVLYIETDDDHGANDLVISLSVGDLKEIVSIGAGRVHASDLHVEELSLEGSGSGFFRLDQLHVGHLFVNGIGATQFEVSGQVKRQVIDLAGLGSYDGGNLASETSEVSVRGSGNIALWVEDILDVNIVGSANVRYVGAPFVVQQVFGSGVVGKVP